MPSSSTIRLSSAFSMGRQKREAFFVNDNRQKFVPGPNVYKPPTTDKTSKTNTVPSWSQSRASRFASFGPSTPGPGSYQITSKGIEGPKFTNRTKPGINSELLASGITATPYKERTKPGPGEYSAATDAPFKKLSYSMSGLNEKTVKGTDRSWCTPGPGDYSDCIQQHYNKLPGSKIHKDNRLSYFLKTSVSGNPEPGVYEKDGFEKLNAQPKYSIGKS